VTEYRDEVLVRDSQRALDATCHIRDILAKADLAKITSDSFLPPDPLLRGPLAAISSSFLVEKTERSMPPAPKQRRGKQPADATPKMQAPYAVVVFNDNVHTFEYVIKTFTKLSKYRASPVDSNAASGMLA
jgi:hypothetical protein